MVLIVVLEVRSDDGNAASRTSHPFVIESQPQSIFIFIQLDYVISACLGGHVSRQCEVLESFVTQELLVVIKVGVLDGDHQPEMNR